MGFGVDGLQGDKDNGGEEVVNHREDDAIYKRGAMHIGVGKVENISVISLPCKHMDQNLQDASQVMLPYGPFHSIEHLNYSKLFDADYRHGSCMEIYFMTVRSRAYSSQHHLGIS
ncbi:hypothetical protein DKX38_011529 [Salix brachista]|uniref:Uncharacterized protein n=1 Tax=Salix brachista TaxID=2182728 RepID=A0A5N5M1N8_9ROSI|nr:hypothetical protein DKX38_011529 [Salix brachista]